MDEFEVILEYLKIIKINDSLVDNSQELRNLRKELSYLNDIDLRPHAFQSLEKEGYIPKEEMIQESPGRIFHKKIEWIKKT